MSVFTDPYQQSYPAALYARPVLSLLAPASVVVNTPTLVTITGTGFHSGSRVWADEAEQATTFVNATTLRYMAEASSVGAQDITVRNGGAVSNGLSLTVTATAEDAPTSSSSKAQIVAWLRAHGVDLDDDALSHLSKAELLVMVDDLLNEEQ